MFAVSLALEQEQRNLSRGPGGAQGGGDNAIQSIGLLQGRGCRADTVAVLELRPFPSLQLWVLWRGAAGAHPGCAPLHTRSFPSPS